MRKKILAFVLVAAMVLSLVACTKEPTAAPATNTPAPTATTAPEPTKVPVKPVEEGPASIDFEDGNFGFLKVFTPQDNAYADPSIASVAEVKGSKVLRLESKYMKPEVYVGIDLGALLGDKIVDVKTIKYDLGVDCEPFTSMSGSTILYTGANADVKDTSTWSVYMSNKNPKTITVDVKEAFTANADNYMVIKKADDAENIDSKKAGKTPAYGVNFFFDNLKFLDKDGKLIEVADKTVAYSSTVAFAQEASGKKDVTGYQITLCQGEAGDWSMDDPFIPGEYFAGATGNVNVTLNFEIGDNPDYVGFKTTNKDWGKPANDQFICPQEENTLYLLQADEAFSIRDHSLTSISFAITKEAADFYAVSGMHFPGHKITIKSAEVSKDTYQYALKTPVMGDWSMDDDYIPGAFFANATGNVNVTLSFEIGENPDYVGFKATNKDWGKPANDQFICPQEENNLFLLQADEAFSIRDHSLTTISFAITKEAADFYAVSGMHFPGHKITIKNAVVSHGTFNYTLKTAVMGDWSMDDDYIPGAYFANATGPMAVTLNFEIGENPDYVGFKTTNKDWGKPANDQFICPQEENNLYLLQADEAFSIRDHSLTSITFVITKEAADFFAVSGMHFPGHKITIKSAKVSRNVFDYSLKTAVMGDWSMDDDFVPGAYFEGATGNVGVILTFEIGENPDYVGFKTTNKDWGKPANDQFIVAQEENTQYLLQADEAFSIRDHSLTTMSFVLTKEAADFFAVSGMHFPGHKITIKSATIIR